MIYVGQASCPGNDLQIGKFLIALRGAAVFKEVQASLSCAPFQLFSHQSNEQIQDLDRQPLGVCSIQYKSDKSQSDFCQLVQKRQPVASFLSRQFLLFVG